ncbi:MAG: hypothetical protein ACLFVU_09000 [Phycisphaerae bacterium]
MNAQPPLTGLIADANVLIDYAVSDRRLLTLISRHIGRLYVPSPVLDEVQALGAEEAQRHGCQEIEPTFSQLTQAAAGGGALSFQDWLCLIIAQDEGWAVLSNDGALRKACGRASIDCIWGLEAMAILTDDDHLRPARAIRIAEKMAAQNPFLTPELLERFRRRVGL